MRGLAYAYIVARDYGFAPNPFYRVCTLATCKPDIRKKAKIGDWIFGLGSKKLGCRGKLIYAMQVEERISYDNYWHDSRFLCKKPIMHGSLKKMYGDNIYHRNDNGEWEQENSHHSLEDGSINFDNLKRDTKFDTVLISKNFFYLGKKYKSIPNTKFVEKTSTLTQGHRKIDANLTEQVFSYLKDNFENGYNGNPILFDSFERYDGK